MHLAFYIHSSVWFEASGSSLGNHAFKSVQGYCLKLDYMLGGHLVVHMGLGFSLQNNYIPFWSRPAMGVQCQMVHGR